MAYYVPSAFIISINVFKQGSFYTIYVSSSDDIRGFNWFLGDEPPVMKSTSLVTEESSGTTVYLVRLVYTERYFVKLQLRTGIVQEKYIGENLLYYLMTDSTYYGYFEEQDDCFRMIEKRRMYGEIAVVGFAVFGALIILLMDEDERDEEIKRIREESEV